MDIDLREQRRASGLSQQQVAELAGCSVAMVRALEGGLRPSASAVLPRIEAVLAEHGAEVNTTADPSADDGGRKAA